MAKTETKRPLQLIVLVCVGIILILLSIVIKSMYPTANIWSDLLNSLGQALIIGPALSWILDLPSMIDYFKKITVESLISNDYLNSLDRDRLVDLRKECTAKIHVKNSDTVEKGLINMDEQVCDLLTQPYVERYRHNIMCHIEGDFFVKTHYIEEYIINPIGNRTTYSDFPITFLQVPSGETIEGIFKVQQLLVKIDNEKEENFTSMIEIEKQSVNRMDIHFDTAVIWKNKNDKKDLSFDYNNKILITRVMVVKTPKSDITYFKRVKLPVKSLKIDYTLNASHYKLVGSCFGTLSYPNGGGMKVIQSENHISIESFDWLLPGNGIFIVKVSK